MWIRLEDKILENYPNAAIGYLTAEVNIRNQDPYVETLKTQISEHLNQKGINPTNFAAHPDIAIWRTIYERDFGVKASTYRSSIEALVRRVVTKKELWSICNVVDLYNCCSILSLLPMGGYDLGKISTGITIRYAHESETFLGIGSREKISVQPNHIAYADEEKLICWLWNHKDSAETCIDENTTQVIFFVDSFDLIKAKMALNLLEEQLRNIHCIPIEKGLLHKSNSQIKLNIRS